MSTKMTQITRQNIDTVMEKAKIQVNRIAVIKGYQEGLAFCLEMIFAQCNSDLEEIGKFQYIIEALAIIESDRTVSNNEIQKLVQLGKTILLKHNLKPNSSKYSDLYHQLFIAHSRIQLSRGENDDALWNLALADQHLTKSDLSGAVDTMVKQAKSLYRLGNVKAAGDIYMVAVNSGVIVNKTDILIKALHCFRLAGRKNDYLKLYKNICQLELTDYMHHDTKFEHILYQCSIDNDASLIAKSIRKGKPHNDWPWILKAALWLYCCDQKKLIEGIPRISTIRKKAAKEDSSPTNLVALKILSTIQEAYDNNIPIQARLTQMEKLLSMLREVQSPEIELLTLGAMCRWVHRYKQKQFLGFIYKKYTMLSQKITEKVSDDALGLMENLLQQATIENYWIERVLQMEAPQDKPMVTSQAQRNVLMAKLAGKIFLNLAKNKLGRTFLSKDIESAPYEDIFLNMVEVFGQLKGPILKLGQQFHLNQKISNDFHDLLPKMYGDIPSVSAAEIKAVLNKELGGPVENFFAEFDDQPLSSASIGQVHKATLPDGTPVVIKVQYPRIRDIIKADLKTFRMTVLPIVDRFFSNLSIGNLVDELQDMLLAECDYRREVEFQKKSYELFRDEPNIIIPLVYDYLCTAKVIVMDHHEGVNLMDFSKRSSIEEKQHVLRTMNIMYGKSYFKGYIFQGDIHPNNYLIEDDKIVFLDYGFTIEKKPTKVQLWHSIITQLVDRNFEEIKNILFEEFGDNKDVINSFVDTLAKKYSGILDYLEGGPKYFSKKQTELLKELAKEIGMNSEWHKILKLWTSADLISIRNFISFCYIHALFDVPFDAGKTLQDSLNYFQPQLEEDRVV